MPKTREETWRETRELRDRDEVRDKLNPSIELRPVRLRGQKELPVWPMRDHSIRRHMFLNCIGWSLPLFTLGNP